MVTDVLDKGTELLVAGDTPPSRRAFGVEPQDSAIELPGVMSRKKQVAPEAARGALATGAERQAAAVKRRAPAPRPTAVSSR